MKTSLIKIRTAFGVHETQLGPNSVELTGRKGTGKSSVLDAIRYALTNRSGRDYIVKQGEDEAEIIIETDTGLSIDRKRKADAGTSDLKLKENGLNVPVRRRSWTTSSRRCSLTRSSLSQSRLPSKTGLFLT